MSFAPTSVPKLPGYVCDGGGFTAKPQMPKYGSDGGIISPNECPKDSVDISNKMSKNARNAIGAAVLLIGGVLLGYGHKKQISNGLDHLKAATSKFLESGVGAKLKTGFTTVVDKAKDLIFAKK